MTFKYLLCSVTCLHGTEHQNKHCAMFSMLSSVQTRRCAAFVLISCSIIGRPTQAADSGTHGKTSIDKQYIEAWLMLESLKATWKQAPQKRRVLLQANEELATELHELKKVCATLKPQKSTSGKKSGGGESKVGGGKVAPRKSSKASSKKPTKKQLDRQKEATKKTFRPVLKLLDLEEVYAKRLKKDAPPKLVKKCDEALAETVRLKRWWTSSDDVSERQVISSLVKVEHALSEMGESTK